MFNLEDFVGILICACIIGAIVLSIQDARSSPWDNGFKGPVGEKVDCNKKEERCA